MITLEESVKLLIEGLAETNRKFAETIAETTAKTDARLAKKLAKSNAATKTRFAKSKAETDAKLAEIAAKSAEELREYKEVNRIGFEELRKSQKKTEDSFNTQWGKLVEALVKNQVVPLFRQRDIPVNITNQRVEGTFAGKGFEFDIIAENGDAIVVIEVKTTLRVDDVRYFLEKMGNFRKLLPRYAGMKVYAAVAFLHQASDAALYAQREGLFSILATGSSATITNPTDFEPQEF